MKTMKGLLGVFVLVSMFMIGQNAQAASKCYDISYDSYCDGAAFCFDTATGLVDGVQTGCSIGDMHGTVAKIYAQGAGVTMGYNETADFAGFVTVIRGNKTWTHYRNDGNGIYELNSGTWSHGAAAAELMSGVSSAGE